jgi:hypothetical protein
MSAISVPHLHARRGDSAHAPAETWRWQATRLLAELRDLLLAEPVPPVDPAYDGWLAARRAGHLRERDALLARLSVLGSRTLPAASHDSAAARVRAELARLGVDVDHHLQRRRDLVWDEVELELGGSE